MRSFTRLANATLAVSLALTFLLMSASFDVEQAEASGTLFCNRIVEPQPDKCVSPVVEGMSLVEVWKQYIDDKVHAEIWVPNPGGYIVKHCAAGNGVWCNVSPGTYEAYAYHDNFDYPEVKVYVEAVYHN